MKYRQKALQSNPHFATADSDLTQGKPWFCALTGLHRLNCTHALSKMYELHAKCAHAALTYFQAIPRYYL